MLFQDVCKETGIFQKFTAPGHPTINGLAKRNVQTLKHHLIQVQEILFRNRATPLSNNKTSRIILVAIIRIQLDALKPNKLCVSTVPERETIKLL